MATFVTKRMIFVHVPKTGGTWVTQAVKSAGVDAWAPDPPEGSHGPAPFHASLREVAAGDRLSVAFVRHPLDWWRSYWSHRMRGGWDPTNRIDDAASDDFNEFVLRVIEQGESSFGGVVRQFIGLPSPDVDFVGRFEHLVEDTCEALRVERRTVLSLRDRAARAREHQRLSTLSRSIPARGRRAAGGVRARDDRALLHR